MPNNLFLSDQGKLSRRLLTQSPRQLTLAPEQGRYMPESTKSTAAIMSDRYEERSYAWELS